MSVPILFHRSRLRTRPSRGDGRHFLRDEATRQAEEALESVARILPRVLTLGGKLAPRAGTKTQVYGAFYQAQGCDLMLDEEWLPFAGGSFDACISVWGMHWVNDVPGMLRQIYHLLAPDGLFLAVVPGAETLRELREVLAKAEAEITGGIHARIAPFPDVREAGALLQRSGFQLPVASSETLTCTYPSLMHLLHELRSMGETHTLHAAQKTFTRRSIFTRAAEYYEAYRDQENRIPASVELITMMGWKPA